MYIHDMKQRITLLLTILLAALSAMAQVQVADSIQESITDTITIAPDHQVTPQGGRPGAKQWQAQEEKKTYFLAGFAVSADFVGLVMKAAGSTFSQLEVAGRLNLKERVFPIFEIGLAEGNRTGNSKDNIFHTSAPYFRVGVDVNANKKRTSNRLMVGIRIGYSSFKYDYSGPPIEDPVWGGTIPLDMHGINASAVWGEAAIGFETKIWSFVRLGWNARYKFRMSQKHYEYGQPWYIPGYGPNGANCWGGTVNLIFDFGRTMKKGK